MAITVVQAKSATTIANDQTVTLDSAATNGNLLVALGWVFSTAQTPSIHDNGSGMTWHTVVTRYHAAQSTRAIVAIAIAAGSPTTIECRSSAGASTAIHVVELAGDWTVGDLADLVDGSASGEDTSTTSHDVDTGITTTVAATLLVGGVGSNNAAKYTLPTSYTRLGSAGANSDAGYLAVSSIDTYAFASTSVANENTTTVLVAIKEASGGGPEEADGAATGTATVAAIGRADARGAGAATASATVAAVGRVEARAVGVATAGAGVSAVGRAASRGLALAAGVATVLAIGTADARATGAATGTASVAAVGRVEARAVGTATGSASVVGLSATPSAAGSATGAATVVGVGRAEHRAAGGAAGSATAAAVGRAEARTVGSASGSATVDGVSSLAGSSGTATGTAAVVGVGRAEHRAIGTASGAATVDGIGRTAGTAPGDGAATGSASVVGVGRAEHRAVGAATGSATATAAGVAAQFAAGAATGGASVVGVGRAESRATGAASGSAEATSTARREIRAVGTATGTATVVGWSQEFILWAETPPCRPTLVSLQPTHDLVSLQPTHSLLGYCDGAWTMTLHLTRGWTAPIPLRLETSDGPVATTGLALTLYARRPDGTYLDTTGDLEPDPDQASNPGKIWWTPDAGDLDIGPVELRVEAIDQTGAAAYFPQGQPLRVSVWRV